MSKKKTTELKPNIPNEVALLLNNEANLLEIATCMAVYGLTEKEAFARYHISPEQYNAWKKRTKDETKQILQNAIAIQKSNVKIKLAQEFDKRIKEGTIDKTITEQKDNKGNLLSTTETTSIKQVKFNELLSYAELVLPEQYQKKQTNVQINNNVSIIKEVDATSPEILQCFNSIDEKDAIDADFSED